MTRTTSLVQRTRPRTTTRTTILRPLVRRTAITIVFRRSSPQTRPKCVQRRSPSHTHTSCRPALNKTLTTTSILGPWCQQLKPRPLSIVTTSRLRLLKLIVPLNQKENPLLDILMVALLYCMILILQADPTALPPPPLSLMSLMRSRSRQRGTSHVSPETLSVTATSHFHGNRCPSLVRRSQGVRPPSQPASINILMLTSWPLLIIKRAIQATAVTVIVALAAMILIPEKRMRSLIISLALLRNRPKTLHSRYDGIFVHLLN